jgi:hypothetical protein
VCACTFERYGVKQAVLLRTKWQSFVRKSRRGTPNFERSAPHLTRLAARAKSTLFVHLFACVYVYLYVCGPACDARCFIIQSPSSLLIYSRARAQEDVLSASGESVAGFAANNGGTLSLEEETALRGKIARSTWQIGKQRPSARRRARRVWRSTCATLRSTPKGDNCAANTEAPSVRVAGSRCGALPIEQPPRAIAE